MVPLLLAKPIFTGQKASKAAFEKPISTMLIYSKNWQKPSTHKI